MASVRALSHYWFSIQSDLFPWLEEQLGELTENEQRLVTTLDLIRIEKFTAFSRNLRGRPKKKRVITTTGPINASPCYINISLTIDGQCGRGTAASIRSDIAAYPEFCTTTIIFNRGNLSNISQSITLAGNNHITV
jgi:hypothetical protein